MVCVVTKLVSTKPLPIVVATETPTNAPARLNAAAMSTACLGVNTFVDTTVAIEFAES